MVWRGSFWINHIRYKPSTTPYISVGIDVSKEKSTVCILKPYGEIISKPFEIQHVEQELNGLASMLLRLVDEVWVVMEATGVYHLPVLSYLQEKRIFVAVINSFEMKGIYEELKLLEDSTDIT